MKNEDENNRFAKVRKSIGKLRTYSDCGRRRSRGIMEDAIEELRLALGELQVIEEELRFQHDELLMARRYAEERRKRYKQLLDLIPEGCLVTDSSGKIREANPAAGGVLKTAPESLTGRQIDELVAEEQRAEFKEQLGRLSVLRRVRGWKVRVRPPGAKRSFEAHVDAEAILDLKDEVAGLHWIIRPATAD